MTALDLDRLASAATCRTCDGTGVDVPCSEAAARNAPMGFICESCGGTGGRVWCDRKQLLALIAEARKVPGLEERVRELEEKATPVEFSRDLLRSLASASTLIGGIAHGLEDEGDRVYLGSTMDADALRELDQELDDYGWSVRLKDQRSPNIYETAREHVVRAKAAEALVATQREQIEKLREDSPELLARLQEAIEGECEGFAISDRQARNILAWTLEARILAETEGPTHG